MNDNILNSVVEAVISELNKSKSTSSYTQSAPTQPVVKKEEPVKIDFAREVSGIDTEKREVAPAGDITSDEVKSIPLLDNPQDIDMLRRMMRKTSARIGVGSAGPRVKTQTMLALRADHAAARDAAFFDVDEKLLEKLNLFTVKTKCHDKNEYLTRPDLGRQFDDETLNELRSKCTMNPDVQIFASDGLSCRAIEANLENVLPSLIDGVKNMGLSVGTPFFVQYGRVASMDYVSECLGAKVTCILVGERPGLGSAESMSAYLAYNATIGMPESNRTVVSNIYSGGITAVEAGAYIADVIKQIYDNKASGVNLKKQ